ncbi:MAG TPA: hypothetical protein VFH09_03065 [Nitrososphaera sp.]|nr:hypothetical protein [Nitrososphaera sp.]
MNNQIIIMYEILAVTILLPTISADFLTLTAPNAFGQQLIFDNMDKERSNSAMDIANTNNNIMTDNNIVTITTTTGTNDTTAALPSNITETIPNITAVDVINSTYIVPRGIDEEDSESRIGRAVRDRINDVLHTVVMSNATIISTATITNGFLNESITTNNNTRLLEEIIPDQVEVAFERIRTTVQPTNAPLELHADIETVCIAGDTSRADCDINIIIR